MQPSEILLNDTTALDLTTLIETRLIVQANSGGGKTWAIRRLLEQSHGRVQHIIIDVEGSLRTLREQYPYLLLGSETDQVDFAISPANVAQLVIPILESHTSTILDLYEFLPSVRQQLVRLFLDALINAPVHLWHDCLVVIDEAHIFCPERGNPEAKQSVEALCSRGRARGFCAVLATQRISKLGKDALGECNNKMIGRASLDIDMKRSNAELEFPSTSQALKKLKPGEFYLFGPAISPEIQKIAIGPVITTHPKAGSRRQMSSPPPPTSLTALLEALKALPVAQLPIPSDEKTSQGEEQTSNRTPHRGRASMGIPVTQISGNGHAQEAEIQRLRQQVELLSKITVTLDGKTFPLTTLPFALHLDTLQIEQATIEIGQIIPSFSTQKRLEESQTPIILATAQEQVLPMLSKIEHERYTQFKKGLAHLASNVQRAQLAYRVLRAVAQTSKQEIARADVLLGLHEGPERIREHNIETLLTNKRLLAITRHGEAHSIYYRSLVAERLAALLPERSQEEIHPLTVLLFEEETKIQPIATRLAGDA